MPTASATNSTSERSLTGAPACPKCTGGMWDNRATKRNPKAPDFKCRDRSCDGALWPGQHRAAMPIISPRAPLSISTHAPLTGTAESVGNQPAPARQSLRSCYLDVTDFVLAEVRPRYQEAGVPCTDATVAAIVATLFIATSRTIGRGDGA